MERRVLLAIVLSFLVLYLYQTFVLKPVQKPAGTPAPAAKAETAGSTQASPAAGTSTAPRLIEPPAPAANPLVGEKSEREIRVETRDVIAVLTNRGARVKSWRLKHYLDAKHEPLELVVTDLAATEPLPFSLRVPDDGVTATLNTALYSSTTAPAAGSIGAPLDLRFDYRDTTGLRVAKTFHFDPSSYIVGFSVNVTVGE